MSEEFSTMIQIMQFYGRAMDTMWRGIKLGIFVPKKSTHKSITESQKSNRLQVRDSCTIIKI